MAATGAIQITSTSGALTVTFIGPAGGTPTVYSDAALTTTVSLPATVASATTSIFYVASPGAYALSVKTASGSQIAGPGNATRTVNLQSPGTVASYAYDIRTASARGDSGLDEFQTDTEASGAYVAAFVCPAASGDTTGATDQTAIQTQLDAALAAGGGQVSLPRGTFYVTGLVIDSLVRLVGAGEGATTIKVANGANQHAIRSRGFENYVPALLNAALAHGVAVTTITVTPLTKAVVAGDTLTFGVTGQTATVAAPGAAIGATSIPVASFTPTGSDNFPTGIGVKLNATALTTAPQGFQILHIRVDGNNANNTSGMGVALYGYRYRVDDVQVFKAAGGGFFSSGTTGGTAAYPDGQVETHIGSVYVAQNGGVGFHYEGPHDGYADWVIARSNGGNGVELANLDGNYIHSYGNLVGVRIDGWIHWNHIQAENNTKQGFVTVFTNPSVTNSISRLTAYTNWTDGTAVAATDFSVLLNNTIEIQDLFVSTAHGEGGVYLQGKSSVIGNAEIDGAGTAGTTGLSISADQVSVNALVNNYPICWTRFGRNGIFRVRATNASTAGYYDQDNSNTGCFIEFTYNATASNQVPWTPAQPTARNTYRLVSNGSVISSFFADYTPKLIDSNALTSGESTLPRWLVRDAVQPSSGAITLSYFTAQKTEVINNIKGFTGSTAAGATPTLARMGLYSVAANGDLTLVAACASDTTLFAGVTTAYTRALTAPYTKIAGQRYAFAYIVVSGATMPNFPAVAWAGAGSEMSTTAPIMSGRFAAQTDLTTPIAAASVTAASQMAYGVVTP